MSSRILPEFELFFPQSIQEAVALLGEYGEKMVVMAGGTDLLVHLKSYGERVASTAGRIDPAHPISHYHPGYMLSLSEIPGLDHVDFSEQDGLRIGAMATLAAVSRSQEVKKRYPAIWRSAVENGTVQTRNTATLVGNLLRASPGGDCCCAVLASGGSVVLQGHGGKREVGIDGFWTGYRETARRADELALEVRIPLPSRETVSSFVRLTRTRQDISKINAAVRLTLDGRRCRDARIAMGCVAPTPLRLMKLESLMKDKEITEELYKTLMESVGREIKPIDDVRSSAEYRREVAGVVVRRAIETACNGF